MLFETIDLNHDKTWTYECIDYSLYDLDYR